MAFEVPRKFEKSYIFFAHVVENADDALPSPGESDNLPAGAAELPLDGLRVLDRQAKVTLEKSVENFHVESGFRRAA